MYLVPPVLLGIAAATFEGMSIGLMFPLLQGFMQKDFSFIQQITGLGRVIQLLPESVALRDRTLFILLISIFVIAVILKNVLRYASVLSMSHYGERAMHHLRKAVFKRYLSFGKLYFDRTSVGHHVTVLSEFVGQSMGPVVNTTKYMNAFFSFIVYIVVMMVISWKLTLLAIPFFAVLHFAVQSIITRVRAYSVQATERGAALGKKSVEILSTVPLVKAYSTENDECKHYAAISDAKAKIDLRSIAYQQLMLPIQEMLTLLAASGLLAGMLYFLVHEQTTAPTAFMVYFYLIVNGSAKFGTIMGLRGTLARASAPVEQVLSVFEDSDKCIVPDGKMMFGGLQNDITLERLSFTYSAERQILEDISVTIPKGKMMAFVGPTGGGKTTIAHLLMRFYDCPPKSIFFDGVDVREFRIHSLLSKIALVSQETLLLHDSLAANITYGLANVSEERLQEAVKRARLSELVKNLPQGLQTMIGDRGVKLSGGEKQRVAIARALVKDAEILILDEATSSMDSTTERLIQEAIDDAVSGRTAIVIAHRLSTIRHADHIVVIDGGRMVEQGTLEELLACGGKFAELWEHQKFH
jgi:ABC-type multidrug transport system fused ATPase/permease subunit